MRLNISVISWTPFVFASLIRHICTVSYCNKLLLIFFGQCAFWDYSTWFHGCFPFLSRSEFVLRHSLPEQCQVCVRCSLGWTGMPVAPPGYGWCPSACIPTIPLHWSVLWCGSRSAPVLAALAESGGIHKLFIQITMAWVARTGQYAYEMSHVCTRYVRFL